jgi:perosamine synthetase
MDAPNVGKLEKEYVNKAIDSSYVSTAGPYVQEFEDRFADYIGVKKAVSTQSGTAAIHMALYELGIDKGNEVIVPALTFIATVNPIIYVGAKPVFVDVDIKTWNINPEAIEKAITEKTRAIMPVHLYGNPCNMEKIMDIAKEHNLYVIEDATESLGIRYKDRFTGAFGNLGCFSFNGNKTITTGGGGMVTGNDVESLEHIKFLVNQSRDKSRGYYHPEIGFNYRMTNIEAALGFAQMDRLNEFLERKRRYRTIYKESLRDAARIHFQESYEDAEDGKWLTCITIDEVKNVSELQERLKKECIPTRRVFMPITEFPPYKAYKKSDYNNAYTIYKKGLCLPSSTLNTDKDIYYVCSKIKEALA